MPDYRGRKGSVEDLLPENRRAGAREIWADREEVAKLSAGVWMPREAAKVLQLPEGAVDEVLRR